MRVEGLEVQVEGPSPFVESPSPVCACARVCVCPCVRESPGSNSKSSRRRHGQSSDAQAPRGMLMDGDQDSASRLYYPMQRLEHMQPGLPLGMPLAAGPSPGMVRRGSMTKQAPYHMPPSSSSQHMRGQIGAEYMLELGQGGGGHKGWPASGGHMPGEVFVEGMYHGQQHAWPQQQQSAACLASDGQQHAWPQQQQHRMPYGLSAPPPASPPLLPSHLPPSLPFYLPPHPPPFRSLCLLVSRLLARNNMCPQAML